MVEVTLKLPGDARKKVLKALREELAELEGKASRLRDEIRAYEEKYGLDSRELVRLWDEALEHKRDLPLPEGADLDLIEWRSLYEIYEALLNDIEELKESIRRLCVSAPRDQCIP